MIRSVLHLALIILVATVAGCAVAPSSAERGENFRTRIDGAMSSAPANSSVKLTLSCISTVGDFVEKGDKTITGFSGMVAFMDDRLVFEHPRLPSPIFYSSVRRMAIHYAFDALRGAPYLWIELNNGQQLSLSCEYERSGGFLGASASESERAAREAMNFIQSRISPTT